MDSNCCIDSGFCLDSHCYRDCAVLTHIIVWTHMAVWTHNAVWTHCCTDSRCCMDSAVLTYITAWTHLAVSTRTAHSRMDSHCYMDSHCRMDSHFCTDSCCCMDSDWCIDSHLCLSSLWTICLAFLQHAGGTHHRGPLPTPRVLLLCAVWPQSEDAWPLLGGGWDVLREARPGAVPRPWHWAQSCRLPSTLDPPQRPHFHRYRSLCQTLVPHLTLVAVEAQLGH